VFIASRRAKGVATIDDYESRLRLHILPAIGSLRLEDVRPSHLESMIFALREKGLASRTIRSIYYLSHGLFQKAIREGLMATNPCCLEKDEIPGKVDHNREWRQGAVFSHAEAVALICDERLPEDRRMFYGVLFLTGMRFGEGAALRWRHYDLAAARLGRLLTANSYSTRAGTEKSVKTENPRLVPVHPVLARMLAEWKLGGVARMLGTAPGTDDLIVPSREGRNRSANHMLKKFYEDLDRLGFRRRRIHDLRRTFISLALADGGRKDILRWITHGPKGDVFDDYTTLPWPALCEEIAKLKVAPPAPVPARLAAVGGSSSGPSDLDRVTFGVTVADTGPRKTRQPTGTTTESPTFELAGWTGLEPAASAVTGRRYNQLNYHPRLSPAETSTGPGRGRQSRPIHARAIYPGGTGVSIIESRPLLGPGSTHAATPATPAATPAALSRFDRRRSTVIPSGLTGTGNHKPATDN